MTAPADPGEGNRWADCGVCVEVPTVNGWAVGRQDRCPVHGSRSADPGYTPDPAPADVELVADTLARRYCWDGIAEVSDVEPSKAAGFRYDAEAVLTALAAAGRLVSPDADTRTQWSVRLHSAIDNPGVGLPHGSRAEAEDRMRRLLEHRANRYPTTADLVQREIKSWPDGSCWVGPWLPVPTTPDGSS